VSNSTPIFIVDKAQLQDHAAHQAWIEVSQFKAEPGTYCLIPGADGGLDKVLVGKGETIDTWTLGNLPQSLPKQTYSLGDAFSEEEATKLCLGWCLGQYQFNRYKENGAKPQADLIFPDNADKPYIQAATEATFLIRDLINTPPNDMGPEQLEAAARAIADTYEAKCHVITGDELKAQQYPMIYAVGQASSQAPRLIDLRWGNGDAPKVTLVGKGVCFDTGGLNLKPGSGMKRMKKDMGGAAHVLGIAKMIMQLQLPVCLRVLVPAVENSVSSNAMRPSDILPTRKGITVEVGNTDAEGRLVLADALWEAASESPDLLIDLATLTGAARVALGTELPACFCNHAETAETLIASGLQVDDPLWQMPLHEPYRELLSSKAADICNISNGSYGGAITAALFLREFIQPDIPWVHIDLMAWNLRSLPGRPEGGEAMGLRALYHLIQSKTAA
jgi:leucyl aminopeptidase